MQIERKKLNLNKKYISQDKEIIKLLYSFTENTYFIKNSTGLGLTHAMCNYPLGNLIILSPNNSMIQKKSEGKYSCDKFLSIYGEKTGKQWDSVLEYLQNSPTQNIVINTNPEQLLQALEKEGLADKLKQFNIVVDEFHTFTQDAGYRPEMGRALEIIYNEFEGKIMLTTATPNPFNFDVPTNINFTEYFIQRENDELKELGYSEKLNDASTFINEELVKGNKVIVFTNNKNIHTSSPSKDEAIKYLNLVGNNLNIKIQPYKRGNIDITNPTLFEDANVIFLSSAYFTGYDIPIDCSVLIISEHKTDATQISNNNVVQAIGRVRNKVHKALFINSLSKFKLVDGKMETINFPTTAEDVRKELDHYQYRIKRVKEELDLFGKRISFSTPEGYVNRSELGNETLQQINYYYQYNTVERLKTFQEYNYALYDYKPLTEDSVTVKSPVFVFAEKLNNLILLDKEQLYNSFLTTKSKIKYKDKGDFNFKDCLMYLTAYLIKEYDLQEIKEMVSNNKAKRARVLKTLNNIIRANSSFKYFTYELTTKEKDGISMYKKDFQFLHSTVIDWSYLYAMFLVSSGIYSVEISRYLHLRELCGDKTLLSKIIRNTAYNHILNAEREVFKIFDGDISNEDKKEGKEILKNSIERLKRNEKYINFESRKYAKRNIINALIQLLNLNKENYKNKENGFREYGAITGLHSKLRPLIPLKFVELDIVSANAQFVDKIIGTNKASDIYKNIMNTCKVERGKAKMLYNMYLNNHTYNYRTAKDFYLDKCGYSPEKAKELAKLTSQVEKGSFFKIMTSKEKEIIESLKNFLKIKSTRFHDALLIPAWECRDMVLPEFFNGYRFKASYFNSNDKYDNSGTETPYILRQTA